MSAPSGADMGRPLAMVSGPGERFLYMVQASFTYGYHGGEYQGAPSTIVQLAAEPGAAPRFVSCLSPDPTPDCTRIPASAVYQPASAAASPDGRNLYVDSASGVARFAIEPSGAIVYAECAAPGNGLCVRPTWSLPARQDEELAVAPDGRDLYTFSEAKLTDFHLGADGSLHEAGCYQFRGACGLSAYREQESGDEWGSVAVGPDGRTVLVATGDEIDSYQRLSDGSLMFHGCLAASGWRCPTLGPNDHALTAIGSIVVAPNGHDVYGLSGAHAEDNAPSALTHLRLGSDGTLAFAGCLQPAAPACEPLPPEAEGFQTGEGSTARQLAVSPDGGHLLVSAGAIDLFRLSPETGLPVYEGCSGAGFRCQSGLVESGANGTFAPNGTGAWVPGYGLVGAFQFGAPAPEPVGSPPKLGGIAIHNVSESSAEAESHVLPNATKYRLAVELVRPEGKRFFSEAHGDGGNVEETEKHIVADMSGLQAGTTFQIRFVAQNPGGTAYGPWTSFTTTRCSPAGPYSRDEEIKETATTLIARGDVNPDCLPTTIRLDYGLSERYEHTVTVPSSQFPSAAPYAVPYHLEATGLPPASRVYYRLSVSNADGEHVLTQDYRRTGPAVPAVVQVAAQTGAATAASGAGTATLHGIVRTGDTGATAEAQIYREPAEEEPWHTVSTALAAGHEPVPVALSAAGLECGHAYLWRLVATAAYGRSFGALQRLRLPCPGEPEETHEPPGEHEPEREPPGEHEPPPPEPKAPPPTPQPPAGSSQQSGATQQGPVAAGTGGVLATSSTFVSPLGVARAPAVRALALVRHGGRESLRVRLAGAAGDAVTVSFVLADPHGARDRMVLAVARATDGADGVQVALGFERARYAALRRRHPSWRAELLVFDRTTAVRAEAAVRLRAL